MPRRSELVMQKVVDRVIDMFHNQNMTQERIAEILRGEGYRASKSAVGRVVKRHSQFLREIEEARKRAEAIVQVYRGNPGTDISEATLQIAGTGLLEALRSIEDFDSLDPEAILNAIAKISRAQGYLARVKLDYEKGFKAGLFAAATKASEEAVKRGISNEAAEEIKRKILGLGNG